MGDKEVNVLPLPTLGRLLVSRFLCYTDLVNSGIDHGIEMSKTMPRIPMPDQKQMLGPNPSPPHLIQLTPAVRKGLLSAAETVLS